MGGGDFSYESGVSDEIDEQCVRACVALRCGMSVCLFRNLFCVLVLLTRCSLVAAMRM